MIRLLILLLVVPGLAMAQVSVNPGALEGLKPSPARPAPSPAAEKPASRPQPAARRPAAAAARPAPARPAPARPAPTPGRPASTRPATKPAGPVRIAPAPPAPPSLPPPVVAPVRPVPPPPPAPVAVPGASGEVSPLPGGIRISFGAGKSDLNAATEAAVRTLARSLAATPSADLNVYAYAAGNADDPSTPRRLSLTRALAVRALLISEGIESTRIYVRALGAPATADGPPDRIDLTRNGTP